MAKSRTTICPRLLRWARWTAQPLKETPLSATVVTRDLLNDQVARLLSDVVKNDASIGEDYAPVGYYGDYEIRGFPIDLATGLEINGMTIAGEQDVPLENKQSVEFLKGIAGVESGVASAGGLIDYVTKRPAVVKALDLATDHRGTAYGAVDLGRFFGSQKQVGARVNLAGERIASYVNDANGWRAMGAGAADWKLNPKAILKGDFEYQHKVERSVCGYQLLGGTTVPDMSQSIRQRCWAINPGAKPNTFDTFNAGTRLDYDLRLTGAAFAAASFSHSLIDDNVVYAYGCYYEAECNARRPRARGSSLPTAPTTSTTTAIPASCASMLRPKPWLTGHSGPARSRRTWPAEASSFCAACSSPASTRSPNPYSPDGVVQDGAVYTYVGSENIYQPIAPVRTSSRPLESAGPRRLWEDSHQVVSHHAGSRSSARPRSTASPAAD